MRSVAKIIFGSSTAIFGLLTDQSVQRWGTALSGVATATLAGLETANVFKSPTEYDRDIDGLTIIRRLRESGWRRLESADGLLARLGAHLKHLNPQSLLERGYSITESAAGHIVRDGSRLAVGDDVTMTFAKGRAGARVTRKT